MSPLIFRNPMSPDEWDAYSAVNENARGRGYTGVAFSRDWRPRRRLRGAQKLVLNAPGNVTEIYAKPNYALFGEAETLFGVIRHVTDGEHSVVR
jgi:hypothetical protein